MEKVQNVDLLETEAFLSKAGLTSRPVLFIFPKSLPVPLTKFRGT